MTPRRPLPLRLRRRQTQRERHRPNPIRQNLLPTQQPIKHPRTRIRITLTNLHRHSPPIHKRLSQQPNQRPIRIGKPPIRARRHNPIDRFPHRLTNRPISPTKRREPISSFPRRLRTRAGSDIHTRRMIDTKENRLHLFFEDVSEVDSDAIRPKFPPETRNSSGKLGRSMI